MFISTQMEDLRKLKEEEVKNLEIKREEDLKMYAAQHQVNFRSLYRVRYYRGRVSNFDQSEAR